MSTKHHTTIKAITLAYFSGTGCTKAIVDCFESQLTELGIRVSTFDIAACGAASPAPSDLLIVFSPVYAFRLADIVENWVKNLTPVHNTAAVIISVSGGGEISPNTACRVLCKRLLKRKGYHMIYEKMMVMPSNWGTQAEPQQNLDLIAIMPQKVNQIISDILSGKQVHSHPKLQDRVIAILGKAEHLGARCFGLSIHASKACNQCGLCIQNCPQKNIRMKNQAPKFGFRCLWCLKCIYACPRKALAPRILKFSVLKNGFDLKAMTSGAQKSTRKAAKNNRKSAAWQGVIDYLNEK